MGSAASINSRGIGLVPNANVNAPIGQRAAVVGYPLRSSAAVVSRHSPAHPRPAERQKQLRRALRSKFRKVH